MGYSTFSVANTPIYASEQDELAQAKREQYNTRYRILHHKLTSAISTNKRQRLSLEMEFQKAQDAEQLVHRANLITSNLFLFNAIDKRDNKKTSSIPPCTVRGIDWDNDGEEVEIRLDLTKYMTAQEEAEDLYSKVRKMKRASVIVSQLLQKK